MKLSEPWVICLALLGVAACGDKNTMKVPGTGGAGGAITPQASGGAGGATMPQASGGSGGTGSGGCPCTGGAGGSGGTVPTDAPLGAGGVQGPDSGLGAGGMFFHDAAPTDVVDATVGQPEAPTPTDAPIGIEASTPDTRRFDATGEASGPVGTGGTGGVPGSGGSGGTGGSSCSNVSPCGGDIVGTWTVTSSCLKVTGQVDMSLLSSGCASAPVTGYLQVSGTWTANANGTYSDNTTTSGNEQLTLPASCLNVSGTTTTCDRLGSVLQAFGYYDVSCSGSGGCTCPVLVKQTGGVGLVSTDPQTSGTYTTSGNVVTTDSTMKYSYCVSGNKMTWTPQSTSPTTTGTVVFQKQ